MDYEISSSFTYEDGTIRSIDIDIKVEDDRKHALTYEPKDGNKETVKEVQHRIPFSWSPTNSSGKFNALSHRIKELMKVKKIAENRIEEQGLQPVSSKGGT